MRFHSVEKITFFGDEMILDVDSHRVTVDLRKVSQVLAAAAPEKRMRYEISPSGYGIHWLELDEDLSIDGLLGVKHFPRIKFVDSVVEDGPSVS